ncbi:Hypothetical protein CpMEX30_1514 [Corynebacterium pseudotuberculosis]|nr:Hypothetical protein CpE19_1449 [Corynebacterium pseudotuberculosis]APQ54542.1 Hypothetical protein CpMEX30_1514 [Corynebacterium pseudotuberculosis]ATB62401.1 Hypothetical protein BFF96_1526 [Corynebacterium pseudotuberculosis]KEX87992.1 hypothetical protein CPTD_01631 [Corynebacterium pseudotuberculosis]
MESVPLLVWWVSLAAGQCWKAVKESHDSAGAFVVIEGE